MKILMLTTNASLMDGINRHILTIAPELNRRADCEVAVCTVFPHAELNAELERKGVSTYSLNAANGHDLRIFPRFLRVMRAYRPDVVHSHVMALFERIVLALGFRGLKYINTVHGIVLKDSQAPLHSSVEHFLNAVFRIKWDAQCVVSDGVRQSVFAGRENGNVYTVYNPLSFGVVAPKQYKLHALLGVGKETPLVGTACRVSPPKNSVCFTRVMCKVLKANAEAHAVVMGEGDEKPACENIVSASGVAARFHFLGYRQDAPQLVRDLNCFVMTSVTEGLPTALLEAMANKAPFAMMEGDGGLKDIAAINRTEGPVGIVVPKGEEGAMAQEICALLADNGKQETFSDKAYTVGKKHFDVESVCGKLHNIYKKVCGQECSI